MVEAPTARPRRAAAVLAALVLVALVSAWHGPAGAQAAPTASLALVSQTLWMEPPGDLSIVLEPRGELPDDAVVTVTVHARVDPPVSGFERAVNGDLPRIVLGLFRTPVAEVPRDDAGRLELTVPVDVLDGEREGAVVLAEEGLYPVKVAVRSVSGDDLTDPMVLFLLRTGPGTASRPALQVATVLPVSSGPTVAPGTTTFTVEPAARNRASLVTDALEAVPDVPLTVVVRPELLDALGNTGLPADAALRDRLAAALGTRPAAPATYVDADPSALVAADLAPELTASLRAGEDVLAAGLPDAASDRRTWVTQSGLDDAGVQALRDLGFRNLLIPRIAVSGILDATGTGELPVGTDGAEVTAAAVDPTLSALMEPSGDDPVLAAYQLLARLSATWLEVTATGSATHGTALVPRDPWVPDPVFLASLLAGLADQPSTHPVTVDELFAGVDAPADPGGAPLALAPYTPQDLGGAFAQRLTAIRFQQAAIASMVPAGTPVLGQVDLVVEMSISRGLDAGTRQQYLDTAADLLAPFDGAVQVIVPSTVTLAGRTSEIPITVRSSLPYPVTVRLRLASPKLVFPEGDPVLSVEGSVQLRVPVEARSNGTFPLQLTAVTPEGDAAVSPTAVATVRVTAVAGLGLALSVGAVLVLITWWVHHARVVRRERRMAGSGEAVGRHPANGVPGGADAPADEAREPLPPGVVSTDDGAPTAEHPVVPGAQVTAEHPVVPAPGVSPPARRPSPDDTAEHPVVGP
jgi:Family of unknown function (DUF6049)